MIALIKAMRPRQWSKNILVFAGAIFARDLLDIDIMINSVLAFIMFCMISSSTYLINDIVDRKKDAMHPTKKFRPIAAGTLSVPNAIIAAVLLILISNVGGYLIDVRFGIIISTYFVTTLLYSLHLKRVVILDVMIIASGFIFRAIGGTFAINEHVSSWLIICTMFLALFFALNKRRAELLSLGDNAGSVRQTLSKYSVNFLDQMINTVAATCLVTYALYTLDNETVIKFGTRNLILTLPYVIYGLFRYLYLAYHLNLGETPDTTMLRDKPILLCGVLYLATVIVIIYF